jgi:hypothetical protein
MRKCLALINGRMNMYEDDEFDEDEFDNEDTLASEQVMGYLIQVGAASWDGMDDFGERIFKFNMPLLQEIMPELYDQIMEDIDEVMLELYEKDLVQVEYNEDLEAKFIISEEGRKELAKYGFDYFYSNDENSEE